MSKDIKSKTGLKEFIKSVDEIYSPLLFDKLMDEPDNKIFKEDPALLYCVDMSGDDYVTWKGIQIINGYFFNESPISICESLLVDIDNYIYSLQSLRSALCIRVTELRKDVQP